MKTEPIRARRNNEPTTVNQREAVLAALGCSLRCPIALLRLNSPTAKPVLANDLVQPILNVRRVNHGYDPLLPTLEFRVHASGRQVA